MLSSGSLKLIFKVVTITAAEVVSVAAAAAVACFERSSHNYMMVFMIICHFINVFCVHDVKVYLFFLLLVQPVTG